VRVEHDGWGVLAATNCRLTVRDSVATGSVQYGFLATSGGILNVEHSEATHNNIGVQAGPTSTARLSETLISENTTGVVGPVTSFGNNSLGGNGVDGSFAATIPES
jgi:hypothetical protein